MKKQSKVATKNKNVRNRYKIFAIIFGVILALVVLAAGFMLYVNAYEAKILPNTEVGNVSIGGLNPEAAKNKLNQEAQRVSDSTVKIRIDDKAYEEKTSNLGLVYNIDLTVDDIFSYAHSSNKALGYWRSFKNLIVPYRVKPKLINEPTALGGWMSKIASEVDEPMQNANIEVQDGDVDIIDPKEGRVIDQKELYDRVLTSFLYFNSPDLTVERNKDYPKITKSDAEGLTETAKSLVDRPLVINIGKESFSVQTGVLGKWIELKINRGSDQKYVSFNIDEIKSYLNDSVAQKVNVVPKDAKFSFSNGKMTAITKSTDGKSLDVDASATEIVKILENKDAGRSISFELKPEAAKINENLIGLAEKLGIKELVGTATTNYKNSPTNRVHNIANGAQYLNGIIIAPGETFSTVGHLGKIDGSSGYLPELVIKEDRTVPEYGGGLCQVSTTLFRAAMNAGLYISERSNHSYRVSYYEPPVGMDATIYSPKPDLRFVNNTSSYILIQSSIAGTSITFDFYGTKDGRRVEITDPYVYDVTPPGDTIYVDDPSLAPGETKQVEKAHNGSKAVFYYKVFNSDGSEKLQQTFRSYYVPWPARILRGPEKPAEG